MRFVWAVVAFVLATVLIGAGIAQRTVFMGPSEERMQLDVAEAQPYVLVDADVLDAHDGPQTVIVRGEGELFGAYGRTTDMTAWLSDTDYTHITLTRGGTPRSEIVPAQQEPAEGESGRDPKGADLWLDSFQDEGSLVTELRLPEGHSMLIARDGVEPAPDDILLTWGLDTRTPLAGPLMVAGGLVLLVGLVLYVLAIRHQRRGRGPRRKAPAPLPQTEPIAVAGAPERPAVEQETPPENPSGTASRTTAPRGSLRRRVTIGVPALALTAALATGCSAESWPQFGDATPTPTPTPTAVAPENQKPPVVGEKQGKRIVAEIAATVAQADESRDIDLAATRLTGAALEGRRTEYALREKIADREGELIAPRDRVNILLPEATDTWPRTVLALTVSDEDDTAPPVLLTMTQKDPWSDYQVAEIADMPASAEFPDVAPEWLGATRVPDSSPFLSMQPADLAAAFADFVDSGDKSEYAGRFGETAQKLAQSVRESRESVVKGLADKGAAKTSKAEFDMTATDEEPLSIATLDSGAVVAVRVTDSETITPTSSDAVIRFGDNAEAKALTGASESAKGVTTTYAMQLFFSVPAQGSNEQIRLLAYHQDLLDVKVIK